MTKNILFTTNIGTKVVEPQSKVNQEREVALAPSNYLSSAGPGESH